MSVLQRSPVAAGRGAVGVPAALFAVVAVVVLVASQGPRSVERVAVVGVVNLVLVVGLYLFTGNSGVWSFGHMSFALVGAYVAGLAVMAPRLKEQLVPDAPALVRAVELPPVAAVVVGGLAAALVALVVAVPLSRIGGLTAGLATVSLLIAFSVVAAQWQAVTRGTRGLSSIPTSTTALSALAWLLVVLLVAWTYQRSSLGIRLRATKADEVAAAASGISVAWQRGVALVLSAAVTGVGGALFALQLGSVNPDVFYLDYTFLVITMLVVGGAGSLTGAVSGAVVVSVVNEALRRLEGGSLLGLVDVPSRTGTADVVLGVLLVLVLLRRPGGITGGRELALPARLRSRFRARTPGRPASPAAPDGTSDAGPVPASSGAHRTLDADDVVPTGPPTHRSPTLEQEAR